MDLKKIEKVMKLMKSYDLGVFDYKDETMKIKLEKGYLPPLHASVPPTIVDKTVTSLPRAPDKYENNENSVKQTSKENIKVITSPLVGTFYQAPSPDSDPFVTRGSHVKKGDVLCIVEAMKLMNELEAEYSGVIKEVLVENGSLVEFGTELFKIELADV